MFVECKPFGQLVFAQVGYTYLDVAKAQRLSRDKDITLLRYKNLCPQSLTRSL